MGFTTPWLNQLFVQYHIILVSLVPLLQRAIFDLRL